MSKSTAWTERHAGGQTAFERLASRQQPLSSSQRTASLVNDIKHAWTRARGWRTQQWFMDGGRRLINSTQAQQLVELPPRLHSVTHCCCSDTCAIMLIVFTALDDTDLKGLPADTEHNQSINPTTCVSHMCCRCPGPWGGARSTGTGPAREPAVCSLPVTEHAHVKSKRSFSKNSDFKAVGDLPREAVW